MGRVLQITDKGPSSGGIRRVVEDHATLLSEKGWVVTRLLLTAAQSRDPQEETAPVPFGQHARVQAVSLTTLKQAARHADIIHLHLGLTAVTPDLIQLAADIAPLVVSLHDIAPFEIPSEPPPPPQTLAKRLARWRHRPARRAVWQAVCDNATIIHAPSRYLADLAQQAGAPSARLIIVPHSVPLPQTRPPELADCPPLVVYAGLLSTQKGAHLLLPCLCALPSDTRLAICGDGPLANTIARSLAQLDLEERVTLTGRIDHAEVLAWMGRARVVVHPSLIPEGFGLTILEAMMLGRPVAGFGKGATVDWLTNDVTGLVAEPANADALAGAVEVLLRDFGLGARLGTAGAARAAALCSPDTVQEALIKLYHTALARDKVLVS